MLTQASYTIKSRAWVAWLLFLLIGGPFVIVLIMNPNDKVSQLFFAISLVFCFLLYISTKHIRIYLDEEKMIISDLIRKRTVLWDDIIFSTVSWAPEGYHSASLNWIFRTKNKKNIEVKLGYYSKSDMIILANQLIERAKAASISDKIYRISEGKFPWYIF